MDDNTIEGTAVVLHEAAPKITFQALVRDTSDPDKSLDNTTVTAERANRDAAWAVIVDYLVKRAAHGKTKLVFAHVLNGGKPKYKKEGIKHTFLYEDHGGVIAQYAVTLVAL